MAEAMASMATFVAVAPEGKVAMGMGNATTFLRPITEGTVHAVGRRRHRGRTTWVWDVDFTDDEGACAHDADDDRRPRRVRGRRGGQAFFATTGIRLWQRRLDPLPP